MPLEVFGGMNEEYHDFVSFCGEVEEKKVKEFKVSDEIATTNIFDAMKEIA